MVSGVIGPLGLSAPQFVSYLWILEIGGATDPAPPLRPNMGAKDAQPGRVATRRSRVGLTGVICQVLLYV